MCTHPHFNKMVGTDHHICWADRSILLFASSASRGTACHRWLQPLVCTHSRACLWSQGVQISRRNGACRMFAHLKRSRWFVGSRLPLSFWPPCSFSSSSLSPVSSSLFLHWASSTGLPGPRTSGRVGSGSQWEEAWLWGCLIRGLVGGTISSCSTSSLRFEAFPVPRRWPMTRQSWYL